MKKFCYHNVLYLIFSILFSFTFVFGLNSRNLGFRAQVEEIVPIWTSIMLLEFIIIALITFLLIKTLMAKLDFSFGKSVNNPKKVFWLSFLFIAFVYLLTSLVYYPANILPDSMNSLNHTLLSPEVALSNHHPICYSALISLFLNIGKNLLKFDLLKSIYLYTLFQILYISFVIAYSMKLLAELKTNRIIVIGCILIYALFPHFNMFAVTMWKDPLFSASIMLLSTLLIKVLVDPQYENSWQYLVLITISLLFVLFFRNNGIYIVLATFCFLLILSKLNITKIIMIGYVVFYFLFTGIGYDLLNIEKVKVEAFAVPLQQTAYTLQVDDKMFNEEDLLFLNKILPIETWKEAYTPRCVDDIKWNKNFDKNFFAENINDFLKIYIRTLPKALRYYVDSYLCATQGFWDPVNQTNHEYYSTQIGIISNNHGIYQRDILAERGIDAKPYFSSMPLVSTGLMFWLILLSMIVLFFNYGKKILIFTIPYISLWVTLMVATPLAFGARYALPLFYGAPVCLVLAFNKKLCFANSPNGLFKLNFNKKLYVALIPLLFPILILTMIDSRDEYITIGYSDLKEEVSFNKKYYYSQPLMFDTDVNINRISFNTYKNDNSIFEITFSIKDINEEILQKVSINSSDLVVSDDGNNWTDIRFSNVKLNANQQYYLEIHGNSTNDEAGLIVGFSSTSPLQPLTSNQDIFNEFLNIKIIGKIYSK